MALGERGVVVVVVAVEFFRLPNIFFLSRSFLVSTTDTLFQSHIRYIVGMCVTRHRHGRRRISSSVFFALDTHHYYKRPSLSHAQ